MFYKRLALLIIVSVLSSTASFALSADSLNLIEAMRNRLNEASAYNEPESVNEPESINEPSLTTEPEPINEPYIVGKELSAKYAFYKNQVYGSFVKPSAVLSKASNNHLPEEFLGENNGYIPGKALAMRLAEYRLTRGLYYGRHSVSPPAAVQKPAEANPIAEAEQLNAEQAEAEQTEIENAEQTEAEALPSGKAEASIIFSAPDLVVQSNAGNDAYLNEILKQRLLYFRRRHNREQPASDNELKPCPNDAFLDKKAGKAKRGTAKNSGDKKLNKADGLSITPFKMPKNYRIIVR